MDYPKHNRHSIRLQGYDYAQPGVYFITIVAHDRKCLFGEIVNGDMRMNECGEMARQCWLEIPNHFPQTQLDEYIIMPDHIHGIIIINDFPIVGAKNFSPLPFEPSPRSCQPSPQPSEPSPNNMGTKIFSPRPNTTPFRSPSQTIGSIVRGFKIGVTKWMHQNTDIQNVWQRNYYEHIVRNADELHRIRQYIRNNPRNWRES
ncbi:transposase [Seramator thermalis]|uniref:transposase n=1 Tax=Seramator thermalis TaxID=2496270 RepID=UPI00101D6803|nr:transposase [Seramator thermalis]